MPVADGVVTLVPESLKRLRIDFQTAIVAKGKFSLAGIAPGRYRLWAWKWVDTGSVLFDPEFLKPYESLAGTVDVAEGAKGNVTLRLIPMPGEE